jgi:tRNA1Val (adenine37-N6)-methyltransferase
MQKALARHEIYLNLAQLIQTANRLLRIGGWMAVVYPAERMADLLVEMQRHGLEPKWVRTVHSYPREPAKLVIVQGVKHGRAGLAIPAPIVIYETDGSYTQEVQMMMAL